MNNTENTLNAFTFLFNNSYLVLRKLLGGYYKTQVEYPNGHCICLRTCDVDLSNFDAMKNRESA